VFSNAAHAASALAGLDTSLKTEVGEGSVVQWLLYAAAGIVGVLRYLQTSNVVQGVGTFVVSTIFVFALNSTVLA